MAFVRQFGNLPIIGNAYNITVGSTDLFNAGAYAIYQNLIEKSTPLETAQFVMANGKDFGILDIGVWGDGHKKLMTAPIKSNSILTQDTMLEYGCTGYHWSFGSPVVDCAYLANPALSLNQFAWGQSAGNGERVFGFAVACYSDSMGARLSGIAIFFFTVNDVSPEQYWRADAFDTSFSYNIISVSTLERLGYTVDVKSSDVDFGDESTSDGYGQDGEAPAFNHASDVIPIPDAPAVSTSSVGFIHLYKVNQSSLATLSQYLFPDIMTELQDIIAQLPVALSDLPNVLVPMLRAFASIFAYRDSVQYIIDLHAIPCPPTVGGNDYIKVGALSTDISVPVITSDYVEVDCGALSIPEQFKNFLDYIVACKLFIPFVGFIDIKPELWNGGTIGLKYRFNVIDGSFMAYVTSTSGKSKLTNTVIGQYGGSACLHLPMVAAEYGAIIGGIVQGAMAVDKVSGAGSASQMASAEAGLASALMNFNANPPMQQSNGYNASAGFMGGRTPYLMIEYPVPQFSKTYTHEKGLPLNVNMAFSSLHGYTEIDANVDLSGINAPVDIIDEIRNALASGTIF